MGNLLDALWDRTIRCFPTKLAAYRLRRERKPSIEAVSEIPHGHAMCAWRHARRQTSRPSRLPLREIWPIGFPTGPGFLTPKES